MNDFAQLLSELEEFRKASPACDEDEDKKMGAKRNKAGSEDDDADDKKIEAAAKDGDKRSEAETFGKAFRVKLEDGTETEAFDGTEMLRALHAEHEGLADRVAGQQEDILKAFDLAVVTIREQREELAALKAKTAEQGTLLKSLGDKVSTIGAAGVGRRTVLAIAEKLSPSAGITGAASETSAPTPNQVLMKAQFMARNNKLDWSQLPRIEAHQGRGALAPDDLLQRYPELLTPVP
jgi:hypothetical protein